MNKPNLPPTAQVSVTLSMGDLFQLVTATIPESKRAQVRPYLEAIRAGLSLPDALPVFCTDVPRQLGRPKTGGEDDRSWIISTPYGRELPATLKEACKVFNITEGSARVMTSKDRTFRKELGGEGWELHRDKARSGAPGPSDELTGFVEFPPGKPGRAGSGGRRF